MFERYAIFYRPPAGPLADFGAAWLGWDAATGRRVAHPDAGPLDAATLTEVARPYGFHGTLKAPFRLAQGCSEAELTEAVATLAARHAPVALDAMTLTDLNGFVALRPVGDVAALGRLEAAVVTKLDPFRGPSTDAEKAKRHALDLTEAQRRHLGDWGYPFVLDAFQFHMTLTRRLDAAAIDEVIRTLGPMIAPHVPQPFAVDAITLLGQDETGMFRDIRRFALTG